MHQLLLTSLLVDCPDSVLLSEQRSKVLLYESLQKAFQSKRLTQLSQQTEFKSKIYFIQQNKSLQPLTQQLLIISKRSPSNLPDFLSNIEKRNFQKWQQFNTKKNTQNLSFESAFYFKVLVLKSNKLFKFMYKFSLVDQADKA